MELIRSTLSSTFTQAKTKSTSSNEAATHSPQAAVPNKIQITGRKDHENVEPNMVKVNSSQSKKNMVKVNSSQPKKNMVKVNSQPNVGKLLARATTPCKESLRAKQLTPSQKMGAMGKNWGNKKTVVVANDACDIDPELKAMYENAQANNLPLEFYETLIENDVSPRRIFLRTVQQYHSLPTEVLKHIVEFLLFRYTQFIPTPRSITETGKKLLALVDLKRFWKYIEKHFFHQVYSDAMYRDETRRNARLIQSAAKVANGSQRVKNPKSGKETISAKSPVLKKRRLVILDSDEEEEEDDDDEQQQEEDDDDDEQEEEGEDDEEDSEDDEEGSEDDSEDGEDLEDSEGTCSSEEDEEEDEKAAKQRIEWFFNLMGITFETPVEMWVHFATNYLNPIHYQSCMNRMAPYFGIDEHPQKGYLESKENLIKSMTNVNYRATLAWITEYVLLEE